jgi:hypothetical protein
MNDPIVVDNLTDIVVALDDIAIHHPATYRMLAEYMLIIRDAQRALCIQLLNRDDDAAPTGATDECNPHGIERPTLVFNTTPQERPTVRFEQPTPGYEPYDGKHPCAYDGCNFTVLFDDEPYCYTHSPDSGSNVPGYSYRAEQDMRTANKLWGD